MQHFGVLGIGHNVNSVMLSDLGVTWVSDTMWPTCLIVSHTASDPLLVSTIVLTLTSHITF